MKRSFMCAVMLLVIAGVCGALHLCHRSGFQTHSRRKEPESSGKIASPLDSRPLPGVTADRIVIEKGARRLTLFSMGKPLKSYRIALGRQPVGAKSKEGDGKTPEGRYLIDRRNSRSRFHRALHISYPDAADRRRAAGSGVSPGGDIMIHGLPNRMGRVGALHRLHDWTDGCVAVTDEEIDEIWRMVPNGTRVEILP